MVKILVHFPVVLALAAAVLFSYVALTVKLWLFILAWQSICATVMLAWDGRNRQRRFDKMIYLVRAGKSLEELPREQTVCGFFLRLAVKWESARKIPAEQ